MYSPLAMKRLDSPSHFRMAVKITVFAGMFRPIAKVSVANRILMSCSWNKISISSFRIGSRPPWWIPIPFFSRGSMCSMAPRVLSSSLRHMSACLYTSSICSFSSSSVKSSFEILSALSSHCLRLKLKTIMGRSFMSFTVFTSLKRSCSPPTEPLGFAPLPFCLAPSPPWPFSSPLLSPKVRISAWKESLLKLPNSSQRRCIPAPPFGNPKCRSGTGLWSV
mmetsp:Transcript_9773/g.33724  ORF Transcript_9773/g.33724 Transcript_9773/m.33724 type:complete len:221 (-) Transcript_9773:644-1306(-)